MARQSAEPADRAYCRLDLPEAWKQLSEETREAVRAGCEQGLYQIRRALADEIAQQVDAMFGHRHGVLTDRLAMLGTEVKTHSEHIARMVTQLKDLQESEAHRLLTRLNLLGTDLDAALQQMSDHQRHNADSLAHRLDSLGNNLKTYSDGITAALGQVNSHLDATDSLATNRFNVTIQALQNLATSIANIAEAVVPPAKPRLTAIEIQQMEALDRQRAQILQQIQALKQAVNDAEKALAELISKNLDPDKWDSNTRIEIARLKAEREAAQARIHALDKVF